jgi:hypothetical protein
MPRINLPLICDTYESVSTALANRRCINLYQQIPEGPAASQAALIGCPGLTQFIDMDNNICRAMIEAKDGRGFAVYGNTLYEVFSGGTKSSRGTVDGTGNVKWATNGFVIVLVTNLSGYFYDLTTDTLTKITDAEYTTNNGTVTDVTYKNGFFVYMTSTYIFNGSVLTTNDGKTFPALSFGSAELEPDGNVAIFTLNNFMYVLGENTIEQFRTVGGAGFPFQAIDGATIQMGCVARDSVVEFEQKMVFLGKSPGTTPALYLVTGSKPEKISTPAIENYIQGLTLAQQEAAICWIYQAGGSAFLVLEVGDATFVYDRSASLKTGLKKWHERQSGSIEWVDYKVWRARHSMDRFGKILVGDRTTSDMGEIGYSTYTEYGNRIKKGFTTQPFGEGDLLNVTEIEMYAEAGVGDATTTDPQLELTYSDSQGKQWSNPIPRSMGTQADYSNRMIWRRLGKFSRDRTLRFYTDDSVKVSLIRLEAVLGDD